MRFPSVKQLRKKFERAAPVQIAPNLRNYLDQAWTLRNEADPDLYKVYVGGRPHGMEDCWTGWDKKQATEFFNFLKQLDKQPSNIQEYGWLRHIAKDDEIGKRFELKRGQKEQLTMDDWLRLAGEHMENKPDDRAGEATFRDLTKSFFHYRKPEATQSEWRVYLHVLPKHRGLVAAHLVNNVWQLEGVTNVKVTGPATKGLDNVVIYHKDEQSVADTLKAVAAYQKENSSAFGYLTVGLARKETEVDGVKIHGVAVAREPYQYAYALTGDKNWKPSFGDFWEQMVQPILEDNCEAEKDAFVQEVHDTMVYLGMDPMHPEQ
jgi:hypothetical protein